jgi:hypothetical protein
VIGNEHLYDEENPTIVLCDTALEDALNMKALHWTEVKQAVCNHLFPIKPPNVEFTLAKRLLIANVASLNSQNEDMSIQITTKWAKKTAIVIVAANNAAANYPFDINGLYRVKAAFLKVLQKVEGVSQTQIVFPYTEICTLLSKYIMENKDRLFDFRNYRIALVENDILGEAFGVKAFARSQVTALMRSQLIKSNK